MTQRFLHQASWLPCIYSTEEFHDNFEDGIMYRYIKAEEKNVSSVEIRSLMRDYMNLSNERPSMLHSTFLNFALKSSS